MISISKPANQDTSDSLPVAKITNTDELFYSQKQCKKQAQKKSVSTIEHKHITFVTGTRADYGKLEPLIVAARDQGCHVSIFITGMHLLERYGLTKIEVMRLKGVVFHEFQNHAYGKNQDIILSNTICGFSSYVDLAKPDLVIVHGDRVEALACAIVCATKYVRCGHIEGGEISGTIDEALRHCNTKLAHHHFVSSNAAAKRVQRLGEGPASIHVIGSPELDYHKKLSGICLSTVKNKYEIKFNNYGICIFHPVTSELGRVKRQANLLFDSLIQSRKNFIVLLPNNDPGSEEIIEKIQTLPPEYFRVLPSMRFSYFSELLRNASCIIGNSSTGVREAPFLGVPSLDFGSRQNGRCKSFSITHANDSDSHNILEFLDTKWDKRMSPNFEFGDGNAANKFVTAISQENFWDQNLQKQFCDQ